jgi:hypothetical protein
MARDELTTLLPGEKPVRPLQLKMPEEAGDSRGAITIQVIGAAGLNTNVFVLNR